MEASASDFEKETSRNARSPIRRAPYRVWQFVRAVQAHLTPLSEAERAETQAILPERAWSLFDVMPASDRRHSLSVLHALQAKGYDDPALLQAALLHDCAKHEGGIRLWHRVAIVLVKAFQPEWPARWENVPPPQRGGWRYPFWVHANHPALGAELAAAAGCDPMAVALVRRHQERPSKTAGDSLTGRLVAALQAADDDN
jgi:hypothetical protein